MINRVFSAVALLIVACHVGFAFLMMKGPYVFITYIGISHFLSGLLAVLLYLDSDDEKLRMSKRTTIAAVALSIICGFFSLAFMAIVGRLPKRFTVEL